MINPPKDVEMGSLDGNLRGGSEKEDGVLLLTSARRLEETLNAHHRRKRLWNTFFLLACCIAVFLDPLYYYTDVISEDAATCWFRDYKLLWTFLGLRLLVDVIYMIDIIISLLGIIRKKCKLLGDCWRTRSRDQTIVVGPPPKGNQSIKARIHKLLPLLPRILVALPILEIIMIARMLNKDDWDIYYTFLVTIPFQYTLRIYDIYASLRRRPIMKTGIESWLKPILDFLPFILASHLFGALWYRLALQRQLDCWMSNCNALTGTQYCSSSDFSCDNIDYLPDNYASLSEKHCPVREENFTTFNFGIYLYALRSNQKHATPFLRRVSLSFWWALRNLSSFGSNLNTSSLPSEIYFSVLISISGMALFLVYLNARVQETRESLKEREAKKKKQLMIPDVDLWLSKNDLPKDLKTVIMDNIHKLENNKVLDVQSILSVLPIHDKKRIIYLLCMASLKKVPLLETTNEKLLKGIVEHLKPVTYNEDNYIAQEGKPLGKMLFITQGIAWTYTANGATGTICDSKWLERGSFCGEEVLHWACKSPSRSDLPISTRTIISQEQVEAFAIRASDLKSVISKFWWYFSMNVTIVSQLEQWEQFAASSILAARCHHHAKAARGPSNWDKFKLN